MVPTLHWFWGIWGPVWNLNFDPEIEGLALTYLHLLLRSLASLPGVVRSSQIMKSMTNVILTQFRFENLDKRQPEFYNLNSK